MLKIKRYDLKKETNVVDTNKKGLKILESITRLYS